MKLKVCMNEKPLEKNRSCGTHTQRLQISGLMFWLRLMTCQTYQIWPQKLLQKANPMQSRIFFAWCTNVIGKLALGDVNNPPKKMLFYCLEKTLQKIHVRYQGVIVVDDFNTNLLAQNSASKKWLDIVTKNGLMCALEDCKIALER